MRPLLALALACSIVTASAPAAADGPRLKSLIGAIKRAVAPRTKMVASIAADKIRVRRAGLFGRGFRFEHGSDVQVRSTKNKIEFFDPQNRLIATWERGTRAFGGMGEKVTVRDQVRTFLRHPFSWLTRPRRVEELTVEKSPTVTNEDFVDYGLRAGNPLIAVSSGIQRMSVRSVTGVAAAVKGSQGVLRRYVDRGVGSTPGYRAEAMKDIQALSTSFVE